jgi:hypothetical protein
MQDGRVATVKMEVRRLLMSCPRLIFPVRRKKKLTAVHWLLLLEKIHEKINSGFGGIAARGFCR